MSSQSEYDSEYDEDAPKPTSRRPSVSLAPIHQPSDLTNAITTASEAQIRKMLLEIVKDNEAARSFASARLLMPSGQSGLKRKIYETCQNCAVEYDVRTNDAEACRYHDGGRILDEESATWDDHDDGCHGPPDAHYDNPDYAGGFIWECCEQTTNEPGCFIDYHRPMSEPKKRVKH